jgi:copper chaperone NosL
MLKNMNIDNWLTGLMCIGWLGMSGLGCNPAGPKPVEIYPEDNCSHCRMAISDQSFAAEIITSQNEVFKFDDIGCMDEFKRTSVDLTISAAFVKNYDTKQWLPIEKSVIVKTDIQTPMGSGKVAFPDSSRAREFVLGHSAVTTSYRTDQPGEHIRYCKKEAE